MQNFYYRVCCIGLPLVHNVRYRVAEYSNLEVKKSTSALFFLVATCNAVLPNLSGSITMAASASRSNLTTSVLCPLTAICNAVCPFLSVLRANCGSLLSNALTISTCPCLPCLAAKCKAFFPFDLDISNKAQSFERSSLTTAVWPLVAADIRGVVFDGPIVLLSPGS